MKAIWVATLNARQFEAVVHFLEKLGTVLIMSLSLVIISCDDIDDLQPARQGSPLPGDDDLPIGEELPSEGWPNGDEPFILYIDVEPDFTSKKLNDSYSLDLNSDQIVDFTLKSFAQDGLEWLLISHKSNPANKILSIAPWYTYTVPLTNGREIFNLAGYKDGEYFATESLFSIGDCFGGDEDCSYNWENKGDRFLGLKFRINGGSHYGWVRIEVLSLTEWIVKDYAYNAAPNSPIVAGQMN